MVEKLFQIIKPRVELQPYVQYYSLLCLDSSHVLQDKVLPVGHVQLILHRRTPFINVENNVVDNQMYVCGQYEKRCILSTNGVTDEISVVLQPWAAGIILHIPAGEFFGKKISINDLEDSDFKLLYKQVLYSESHRKCIDYIEQFLIKRISTCKSLYYINPLQSVLNIIDRQTNPSIKTLADALFLGNKQFTRVFVDNVGISAKTLSRIVRFQKSIKIIKTNPMMSLSQVAEECGYTDLSHMIKDYQNFLLESPKEFFLSGPQLNIYSDYFAAKKLG